MSALRKLLPVAGFVRLSDADITAIAGFLGLGELDFIERYPRLPAARWACAHRQAER